MQRLLSATIFCACASISGAGFCADVPVLEPGEYEVSVRLELPHLEDMAAIKLARICMTGGEGGTHGLVVLSDNNPLAHCPASNIHEDGGILSFDIVCPGGNAAPGHLRDLSGGSSKDRRPCSHGAQSAHRKLPDRTGCGVCPRLRDETALWQAARR